MKEFWQIFGLLFTVLTLVMMFVEDCNEVEPPEPINENGYHPFSQKYGQYRLIKQIDTCGKYPTIKETITIDWNTSSKKLQLTYGKLAWKCIDGSMVYTASDGRTYSSLAEPRKFGGCALGGKIHEHIHNSINELATLNMKNIERTPEGKYIYTVEAGNTNYGRPFLEWRSDEPWKGFNYLKWRIDNCD